MPKVKTWLGELSKKHANFVFQRRYGTKSYFYLKPKYPYKASSAQQTIRNRYKLAKNHYKNLSKRSKYLYAEKLDSEALSAWNQLVRRVEKTLIGGEVLVMFFDELQGDTVFDVSGNGNHGSINGATWFNNSFGLSFDGTDDYVEVPHSESLNITDAITIAVWVKLGSLGQPGGIVCKDYDGTYTPYVLRQSVDNKFWFYAYANKVLFQVYSPTVSTNTLYHVVATFDKDLPSHNAKMYLNKNIVDSADYTSELPTNSQPVRVGLYYNNYLNGIVYELRIYDRALSQEEIKTLYKTTKRYIF